MSIEDAEGLLQEGDLLLNRSSEAVTLGSESEQEANCKFVLFWLESVWNNCFVRLKQFSCLHSDRLGAYSFCSVSLSGWLSAETLILAINF